MILYIEYFLVLLLFFFSMKKKGSNADDLCVLYTLIITQGNVSVV